MNKNILLIMIAVIGVGGWLALNSSIDKEESVPGVVKTLPKQEVHSSLSESLIYVPADTLVFSGGLTPISKKEFQALTQNFFTPEFKGQMDENIKQIEEIEKSQLENPSSAVKMLFGFYIEYMKAIKNPESFFSALGFSDAIDAAIYTIDTVPVLRTKLNNTEGFEKFISHIEQTKGIKAEQKTLKDIQYRSYSFDTPNSGIKTDVELLIAIENNFAVISVHSRSDTPEQVARLMGLEKPTQSLGKGEHLKAIMKKHGLLAFSVSYINHSEIIKSITQEGGTAFGKIVDDFNNALKKTKAKNCEKNPEKCIHDALPKNAVANEIKPSNRYRTAECRDDLMAMFSDPWPQTVLGYTSIGSSTQPSTLSTRIVLESNDEEIMNNLKTLRGHIPVDYNHRDSGVIFGSAVGFNVDALGSYSANVLNNLSLAKYQCQPLVEMQQKNAASKQGLAMAMFSGFAAGLQGFSTNLFDLSFEDTTATEPVALKTMDALLTISAKDPQTLIMAAKGMAPPSLAGLQIPTDGSAVVLPFPLPLPSGIEPKLAIKGNHIVLYVGEQAEAAANNLKQTNIAANGVFDMSIDYGKYMKLFLGFLKKAPTDSSQAKALEALKGLNMKMTMSVDFKDSGIVMDADTTLRSP